MYNADEKVINYNNKQIKFFKKFILIFTTKRKEWVF